jgi:Zn-dependent protease
MENAIQVIFQILIILFSVVIHEVSHGYAALSLGDRTAQNEGRLTLNPIKHLDPFGSILLPMFTLFLGGFVFGWAKPVPYNPHNLRNPFGKLRAGRNWGPALVGAAGPLANISLALVFGIALRFLPSTVGGLSGPFITNFITIASIITLLNLVLAVFNLVPVPPLDGSKVLFALLPYNWRNLQNFLEQYGFFVLLLFIFFFSHWIFPVVIFLFRLITGSFPFI